MVAFDGDWFVCESVGLLEKLRRSREGEFDKGESLASTRTFVSDDLHSFYYAEFRKIVSHLILVNFVLKSADENFRHSFRTARILDQSLEVLAPVDGEKMPSFAEEHLVTRFVSHKQKSDCMRGECEDGHTVMFVALHQVERYVYALGVVKIAPNFRTS